jgi:hypothetical protein
LDKTMNDTTDSGIRNTSRPAAEPPECSLGGLPPLHDDRGGTAGFEPTAGAQPTPAALAVTTKTAAADGGQAPRPSPANGLSPGTKDQVDRPSDGHAGTPSPSGAGGAPDPFDPARLRLSQDFASTVGVKKALLTVPVRKPAKEWFIRVHPDMDYRIETAVVELKEEREIYLVDPGLWDALAGEATFGPRQLLTSINRQGTLFLWPIRLPGPDGKIDDWNRSALAAGKLAQGGWVRLTANLNAGHYDVFVATASLADPEWPDLPFKELLRIAFKDRLIESLDHPVLKKLRGEL